MNWLPSCVRSQLKLIGVKYLARFRPTNRFFVFYCISVSGDLVPAKAIPSKQIAYVSFDGEEIAKYDYHVSEHKIQIYFSITMNESNMYWRRFCAAMV